ncbi:MAG: bifunctional nuclease family protein [Anaerolineae bacterium]|nr:bifunctional nuclease family protein [Anaerolineae bacterium]
MIEVEVSSIRVSLMNQQRVVLLKDISADRYLPIWIGPFEAEAINLELQNARRINRPMTHDLIKSVIEHLNGKVIHILINDMRRDVFYARLVIEKDGEQVEIDSRPSDAIAIAVRTKAPIFVNEAVLEKHSVEPEEDIDLDAIENSFSSSFESGESGERRSDVGDDAVKAEEIEAVDESQLSSFSDFVNSLDLDLEDPEDDEK